jgi:ATP-dependent Clp protease ATP-binding subunit ClpB
MNLNNYTIKAQETIQAAQQVALTMVTRILKPITCLKALLADKTAG